MPKSFLRIFGGQTPNLRHLNLMDIITQLLSARDDPNSHGTSTASGGNTAAAGGSTGGGGSNGAGYGGNASGGSSGATTSPAATAAAAAARALQQKYKKYAHVRCSSKHKRFVF